jgi:hypothetical protein
MGAESRVNSLVEGDNRTMIFVSHADEDRDFALALVSQLESAGTTCWIAPRNIPSGSEYPVAIADAIRRCDAVIVILSRYSNRSAFVTREIERAVSQEKPVHTVRVEDVQPEGSLELLLAAKHWIDAIESDARTVLPLLLSDLRPGDSSRPPARRFERAGRKRVLVASLLAGVVLVAGIAVEVYLKSRARATALGNPESLATHFLSSVASARFDDAIRPVTPIVVAALSREHIRAQMTQLHNALIGTGGDTIVYSSATPTAPPDNRIGRGQLVRVQKAGQASTICVDLWLKQESPAIWSIGFFSWVSQARACSGTAAVDSAVTVAQAFLAAVNGGDVRQAELYLGHRFVSGVLPQNREKLFSSLREAVGGATTTQSELARAFPSSQFGQPPVAGDFVIAMFNGAGALGPVMAQVTLERQSGGAWGVIMAFQLPRTEP